MPVVDEDSSERYCSFTVFAAPWRVSTCLPDIISDPKTNDVGDCERKMASRSRIITDVKLKSPSTRCEGSRGGECLGGVMFLSSRA